MEKISCIITTYNEGRFIEKCLESIKWINEIIIIDLGSNDNTLNKAKLFTKNIYKIGYAKYVEEVRNFGLAKALNEWILIIDPDEYLPVKSEKIIKELIKTKTYDAFAFPRRNYISPDIYLKHGYFYPDYQTRLFRNNKNIKYLKLIHKQPSIPSKKNKIVKNLEIYHNFLNSKYRSLFHFNKFFRYIKIEGKIVANSNKKNLEIFREIPLELTRHFYRSFIKLYGYKDGYFGLRAAILYCLYKAAIPLYSLIFRSITP